MMKTVFAALLATTMMTGAAFATSGSAGGNNASAVASSTATGGRGGDAKQGQIQGQKQGQGQSQSSRNSLSTKQLNEQSASSNSGGNEQGTNVGGDSTKVDPSIGYSAPSLAISENNVIGGTEAITNWFFQVPAIGGGGGSATMHTTIKGVPLVAEALKVAGDPAYAAYVEKVAYDAKLADPSSSTYHPAPDEATSRAYAAVMCVEFSDVATKYGLHCE